MFIYEKKLQFPVKIATPNPKLAAFIISQYGGPDGELGASMRYLSQRYSMPYAEAKGLLTDIGTEELGHMEMVSIPRQLRASPGAPALSSPRATSSLTLQRTWQQMVQWRKANSP